MLSTILELLLSTASREKNAPSIGVVLVNHGNEEIAHSVRPVMLAHQSWIPSRHAVRQWTMTAGVVIAYVALEWISFIHEANGLPLTPWNPGLGFVFACLLLSGLHYGIAL